MFPQGTGQGGNGQTYVDKDRGFINKPAGPGDSLPGMEINKSGGGGNQPEPRMDYSSSQQGRTGYVAGNTGTTQGSGGALRDPADFPSRQNPNQMVGGGGSTGPWNQGGQPQILTGRGGQGGGRTPVEGGQPQILTGRGGQGGGLASLSNQAGGFQMPQSMGGGMPMQVMPMAPNQSVVSKAGPKMNGMKRKGGLGALANQASGMGMMKKPKLTYG